MSKRFAWLLGVVVLVSIGLLVACGTKYNPSSNGLVLVGSQGSALVESFGFDLSSGHISEISNPPSSTAGSTCVLPGVPSAMVMDPAGAYVYAIVTTNSACPQSQTGIISIKIKSDGTVATNGVGVSDPNPVALAMDSAGKYLFVAEGTNSDATAPNSAPCPGTTAQYGICVYAIGSGGALTPVPGNFTPPATGTLPDFVALAPTPTIFPPVPITGVQNGACSAPGTPAPTSQFLYVADQSNNNAVWEFGVDMATGTLTNPPGHDKVQIFPAGAEPNGIAVDTCNRFVYVGNLISNNVSAYTICNASSTAAATCPVLTGVSGGDGTLVPVASSPFSMPGSANGPGPMLVDPFGNFLYVVGTRSNTVSPFRITPVSGSITGQTNVATGLTPTAIAVRSDDSWLFVTDYGAATLSQYAVTPASGALTPETATTTDNYPWGVAVK
ncbi:MAG TPA: beta-propeller fold lactonase family protein [Candidatus Sulfotelmatobacter sp.]|nr:beta-propeller fold lactonase family protein [Candidatus Sulfotelmatobacter sp.]